MRPPLLILQSARQIRYPPLFVGNERIATLTLKFQEPGNKIQNWELLSLRPDFTVTITDTTDLPLPNDGRTNRKLTAKVAVCCAFRTVIQLEKVRDLASNGITRFFLPYHRLTNPKVKTRITFVIHLRIELHD